MFSPYWTNEWVSNSLIWFSIWICGTNSLRSPLIKMRKCFCWGPELGDVNSPMQTRVCLCGQCRAGGRLARREKQKPGRAWSGLTRKAIQRITDWWKREGLGIQETQLKLEMGRNQSLHLIQWARKAARNGDGTRSEESRRPLGQRKQWGLQQPEPGGPGLKFFGWWECFLNKELTHTPRSLGECRMGYVSVTGQSLHSRWNASPRLHTEGLKDAASKGSFVDSFVV